MQRHVRCLCTSARLHSQLGRFINKVISSDTTKKSRKRSGPYSPMSLPFNPGKPKQTHNTRRSAILNKVFMKHVTDLMSTGEVAPSLVGRGIEVTHVNVAPDFSVLNVYWTAQNNNNASISIENVLNIAAGHLQHELTQLRVIGRVPPINFVKNKQYGHVREVEDRLSKVDFGEDYEPSNYIITSNNTPVLKTSISQKVKEQLEKLKRDSIIEEEDNKKVDEKVEEEDEAYEIHIPEMRQNIMGVDHSYILSRVKLSLGKAKAAEEKKKLGLPEFPTGSQVSSDEVNSFLSSSSLLASSEKKLCLDEFIKKRLADEKRKTKALPLWESKAEAEYKWHEVMGNDEINDYHVDDEYNDDCNNRTSR